MAEASTDGESNINPILTLNPSVDLRKDSDNENVEKESASQKLVNILVEKREPIGAVVTKNMKLLDEILMSERFQKLKIQKLSQKKDNEEKTKTNETTKNDGKDDVNTSDNDKAETEEKTKSTSDDEASRTSENKEASSEQKMDTDDLNNDPFPGSVSCIGKEQMELNQAMLTAVSSKQSQMLDKILATGADIHAFDKWYPVLHTIVDMASEELFDVAVRYATNMNVVSHYGNLLHSAVRTGSFKLVKKVYDLGVTEFIKCEGNGASVLHEAVRNVPCMKNNVESNESEAKQGNDYKEPSAEDSLSESSDKNYAILQGEVKYDLSIIKFLLEKQCPVDDEDFQGQTPLIESAIYGNKIVAEILVKAGASLSHIDKRKHTPWLHSAVYSHSSMWEVLLDKENLNKPMYYNDESLLHVICKYKLDDALQFLLSKGADPLVAGSNGETPLVTAINSQATECIKVLLNHSECGLHTPYKEDWTPFKRFLFEFGLFEKEDKCELLKFFVEKGVDINAEYPNGEFPLIYHMTNGNKHVEIVKALLDNGANPNYIKNDGNYPLFIVCNVEEDIRESMLHLLLEYNADVTLTSKSVSGFTPLQIAMDMVDFKLTRLCLLAGFSLYMVHDWLRIEQEKLEELKENGFNLILKYIKYKGYQPMSLKGLSRIKVLHYIGFKDKEAKIKSLGLPKIMEDYLDWKKYFKMREMEFEDFKEKFGSEDE